ncbi:MAG: hypothetical protein ACLQDQ_01990, partial [Myxococcaceae bacterium]
MHPLLALIFAASDNPFDAVHLPVDASESGWRIDETINSTTLFVLGIFAIYMVWILWACFRYGPEHKAAYDHGSTWKSWRWTVLVAALMFFVIDGDLFFRTVSFINEVYLDFAGAEAKPGSVRIEINAHQWAWNARYAGPDGKFNTADDIIVLNDLVVPQGAPVIFQV